MSMQPEQFDFGKPVSPERSVLGVIGMILLGLCCAAVLAVGVGFIGLWIICNL